MPNSPYKLTADVIRRMGAMLGAGASITDAAASVGVDRRTYRDWLHRGAEQAKRHIRVTVVEGDYQWPSTTPDGKACMVTKRGPVEYTSGVYRAFRDEVLRAEAAAAVRAETGILAAGRDSWQAYARWLESKRPRRWIRGERHELSGPKGAPIETVARVVIMPALEDDNAGSRVAPESRAADGIPPLDR